MESETKPDPIDPTEGLVPEPIKINSRTQANGTYVMTDAEKAHHKAMLLRGLQTVSNIKKLVSATPMNPNAEAPETLCGKKELDEAQAEVEHLRWKLERREALISDLRREVSMKLVSIRLGASSEVKTQMQSSNRSAEDRALELEDKLVMLELRLQDQCAETNYAKQKLADEFSRAKAKNEEYQKFVFSSQEKYNEVLRARLVADYALAHQKTVSESHLAAAEGYRTKLREMFTANQTLQSMIDGLDANYSSSASQLAAAAQQNEQHVARIAVLEATCASQAIEVADTHAKVEQYATHYDRLVGELDGVVEKMTVLEAAAAAKERQGAEEEAEGSSVAGGSGYESDSDSSSSESRGGPAQAARTPRASLPMPSPRQGAKPATKAGVGRVSKLQGSPRTPAAGRAGFRALKPISMASVSEDGSLASVSMASGTDREPDSATGSVVSLAPPSGGASDAAPPTKGKPGLLVGGAAACDLVVSLPVPGSDSAPPAAVLAVSAALSPVGVPSPTMALPNPVDLNRLAQLEHVRMENAALVERAAEAEARVAALEEQARVDAARGEETRGDLLQEIKGLTDELEWKKEQLETVAKEAAETKEVAVISGRSSPTVMRVETPGSDLLADVNQMISCMQSTQGMPVVSSASAGRGPGVPVVYDTQPSSQTRVARAVSSPVSFCDSLDPEQFGRVTDTEADVGTEAAVVARSLPSTLVDFSMTMTELTDTVLTPPNEEGTGNSEAADSLGGLQDKIVSFWGSRAGSPTGAAGSSEYPPRTAVEQCDQCCQTEPQSPLEMEIEKGKKGKKQRPGGKRSQEQATGGAEMAEVGENPSAAESAPVPLKVAAALRSVGCNTLPQSAPPVRATKGTMTPAPPPFFADRFLARMSLEYQSLSRQQLPYMSFPELAPDQIPRRVEDDGGKRALNMRCSHVHRLLSTSAAGPSVAAGTSFSTQAAPASKSPTPAELQRRLRSCLGYVEAAAKLRNRFILEIPPVADTLQSRNVVRSIDLILQTVTHYLSPCGRRAEEEYPELFPGAQPQQAQSQSRRTKGGDADGAAGRDTFRLTQPPTGTAALGSTPGPIVGLLREHPEWHLNRNALTPQIRDEFVANLYEKIFESESDAAAGVCVEEVAADDPQGLGSIEPSLVLGTTEADAVTGAGGATEGGRRAVSAQDARRPAALEGGQREHSGGRPATATAALSAVGGAPSSNVDADSLFAIRRLVSTQPPAPGSVHAACAGDGARGPVNPVMRAGAHPTEFFHSLKNQHGASPQAFNELFDRYYGEILRREKEGVGSPGPRLPEPGAGLDHDSVDATYFHSSVEQSFEFNESSLTGRPEPVTKRHNRNNAHCDDFNVGIQQAAGAGVGLGPAGPRPHSGGAEQCLDLAIRPGDLDCSVLGNSARLDLGSGSGADFEPPTDASTARRAVLHNTYMYHENAGEVTPGRPTAPVSGEGTGVSGVNYLGRQRILTARPHCISESSVELDPARTAPVVTTGALLGATPVVVAPVERTVFVSSALRTQGLVGRHGDAHVSPGPRATVHRAHVPNASSHVYDGESVEVVARFGGGLEGAAVRGVRARAQGTGFGTPSKAAGGSGSAAGGAAVGWQSGEYNPSVLRDLLCMARQSEPPTHASTSPQPPERPASAQSPHVQGRGQHGRRPVSASTPRGQSRVTTASEPVTLGRIPIASPQVTPPRPTGVAGAAVVNMVPDALPQRPKSAYSRMPARKEK